MKKVLAVLLSVCFVLCLTACNKAQKPDDTTGSTTTTTTATQEDVLSAETVRKSIRQKCDGTYADAKKIFEEDYPGKEFLLEYFFTDTELQKIKRLENNGENQIFYETYDKGWVEIVSLVGEVGDEQVYVGDQDPFVKDFVWE